MRGSPLSGQPGHRPGLQSKNQMTLGLLHARAERRVVIAYATGARCQIRFAHAGQHELGRIADPVAALPRKIQAEAGNASTSEAAAVATTFSQRRLALSR